MSLKEKNLNKINEKLTKKQYNKLQMIMSWWVPLFPEFFETPQTCYMLPNCLEWQQERIFFCILEQFPSVTYRYVACLSLSS